jgi:hypothetical protein
MLTLVAMNIKNRTPGLSPVLKHLRRHFHVSSETWDARRLTQDDLPVAARSKSRQIFLK